MNFSPTSISERITFKASVHPESQKLLRYAPSSSNSRHDLSSTLLDCSIATVLLTAHDSDGPLLQRASTVTPAPINRQARLNVKMSPEIPTDFTGYWDTFKEEGLVGARVSIEYNRTIPTPHGRTSNYIPLSNSPGMYTNVFGAWTQYAPLSGVVTGCPGMCRTVIKAPAMFPTSCVSRRIPVAPTNDFNSTAAEEGIIAPPLSNEVFFISANLVLGNQEMLNINTAYATMNGDCSGMLNSTTCEFVAGVGEYEVTVKANNIMMESVHSPAFVAFANNTAVNHAFGPTGSGAGHPSTLAGLGALLEYKWDSLLAYYHSKSLNDIASFTLGAASDIALAQFTTDLSPNKSCAQFSDPHNTVVDSINKLMLYTGAYAAQQGDDYLKSHLDPGLEVRSTPLSTVLGDHDVYHVNYWFFLAAALVEFGCIMFVAPTCKPPAKRKHI